MVYLTFANGGGTGDTTCTETHQLLLFHTILIRCLISVNNAVFPLAEW